MALLALSFAQNKRMRQRVVTARSNACAHTHERIHVCLRFSKLLHSSLQCSLYSQVGWVKIGVSGDVCHDFTHSRVW